MTLRLSAALAKYGIQADVAEAAGVALTADASRILGRPDLKNRAGLVLRYYTPAGALVVRPHAKRSFCRIRLDAPLIVDGKPMKYVGNSKRAGGGSEIYHPLQLGAAICSETQPLWIVEGELKTLAGIQHGLPCIGVAGNYGWMSGGAPVPGLDWYRWRGRMVVIVFDTDNPVLNPKGWSETFRGRNRLVVELRRRGAKVFGVDLSLPMWDFEADGDGKLGLDDFLLRKPPGALKALPKVELPRDLDLDAGPAAGAVPGPVLLPAWWPKNAPDDVTRVFRVLWPMRDSKGLVVGIRIEELAAESGVAEWRLRTRILPLLRKHGFIVEKDRGFSTGRAKTNGYHVRLSWTPAEATQAAERIASDLTPRPRGRAFTSGIRGSGAAARRLIAAT